LTATTWISGSKKRQKEHAPKKTQEVNFVIPEPQIGVDPTKKELAGGKDKLKQIPP